MDISRALKEGLSLANRNLPIILVKLVVAFIGILGFIFFVILPVSFALFLAGVSPFILTNLQAHEGLITSLPWVMLFSVFALVVFLLFSIAMNLFVYAATVGLMIKTKRDPAFKFRLGDFFSNGKRGFWPIFNYLALTGTSTVVLIIMAAGTVFLIRNLLDYLKEYSVVLSTFIGLFATVVGITVFAVLLFLLTAVSFYGSIEISISRRGPFETFKQSLDFLMKEKGALIFIAIVGIVYTAVIFITMLIGFPCTATPAGMLISFPYHFIVFLVNSYTGLWALGSLVSFYLNRQKKGLAEIASPPVY